MPGVRHADLSHEVLAALLLGDVPDEGVLAAADRRGAGGIGAAGYVGLYGNVAIPKAFCVSCETVAFVLDGFLACCDSPLPDEATLARYKRESIPEYRRRLPPKRDRQDQLNAQDFRCFYCERAFGSFVTRRTGGIFILRVEWDHFVPFVYGQDNHTRNFVAACHVCNGLKGSRCYRSAEEARLALSLAWAARGIT